MKKTFKSFIRDLSLKWKLVLTYTVVVVFIVLMIGLVTYNICVKKLEESEKKLLFQNLKQTVGLVDFNLGMYMKKSDIIFSNTVIQSVLSKQYGEDETLEIYDTYQEKIYGIIEPIMQDIIYPDLTLKSTSKGVSTDMAKIIIYVNNPSMAKDGWMLDDFEKVKNEEWVLNAGRNPKGIYWRGLFKYRNINYFRDVNYISLNRVMKDFSRRQEIGILTIMVPEIQLINIISQNNANPEISIFLVDSSGNIVVNNSKSENISMDDIPRFIKSSGPETEGIESIRIGSRNFIFACVVSEITGWKLIGLYPYRSITEKVQPIKYAVAVVLLLGTVLSVGITVIIAYFITLRLGRITRKMNKIKLDRYSELEEMSGNDEIGQLDRNFNDMVRSLNELVERESRLKMQKTTLQVELLLSQINPHILYNTLATIGWRVKKTGLEDVYDVIEKLIRFFKYFLNSGNLITSLKNEIDMIRKYIDILRFTYNLDCTETFDIEEEVYRYASLNLILQPIVENAMIHGIKPSGRPGFLEIEGKVNGEVLCFKVRDNGIGMEPEKVSALEKGNFGEEQGGYGLSNVIKRIRLYYGEEYGIQFESCPGKGTAVSIKIPAYTYEDLKEKIDTVI